MDWSELEATFGAFPDVPEGTRVVATPQALITADNVDAYSTTDIEGLRSVLLAD